MEFLNLKDKALYDYQHLCHIYLARIADLIYGDTFQSTIAFYSLQHLYYITRNTWLSLETMPKYAQ